MFGGNVLADSIAKTQAAPASAAESWRETLSRIPTHFGRLVFIASLRHASGSDIADRTICHSHHQIFSEWLGFTLAQQKADLDNYLMASQTPVHLVPYREFVPRTAHQVERQLYLTDLETLLELLRFEHGGPYRVSA